MAPALESRALARRLTWPPVELAGGKDATVAARPDSAQPHPFPGTAVVDREPQAAGDLAGGGLALADLEGAGSVLGGVAHG